MLDAMLSALSDLLTLQHLLYMLVGVTLGLSVGVFPGLGGIAGLSLLLPFIYGMDPTSALAMLIGLVAVIPTSDTFASVLMGIPGSSASQATVLDGFPLSRQGHAARALSAAFVSSLFGGLVGAIVLTGFVLIARPLILLFTSAELFMLSVFGLSMVGVLAGRSLAKGLGACGLGLVIGSIGGAPATGEFRMIFNTDYLYDGIPLVIVGLGLFAVPEIVDLLRRDQSISSEGGLGAGWFTGLRDWWKNWWLSLRCAGLGTIIGAIPGLGGSVVDWLAYGHAMQSERNTENFGKGDIRGVIAPESANNAKEGGGLLPTLMFGIPGSGSMAVFLGGMVLIGIEPGPSMVTTNLDVTYTIIWSLALANVLGAGLCIILAQPIARLTTIPFPQLAPFMIAVISFAAFQATRSLADLVALLVIGVIGVFMRRFGWPRPALLIGFVLAAQSETYLYQAVQFYGWEFILRPGCLILLAFILLSVWFGMRNRVDDTAGDELRADIDDLPSEGRAGLRVRMPQILFALFAGACFAAAFVDSLQHSFLGRVFPLVMASAGFLSVALLTWQLVTKGNRHNVSQDTEVLGEYASDSEAGSLWSGMFWIASLVALSALLGFFAAMVVFFVLFLTIRARTRPLRTILLTAGAAAFVLLLSDALNLRFPEGLLQTYVSLPWPFG
ncbi:tripartite tricarboxylate transporter permease [Roseivivax isoporae]|uniref:Tricarboxylate transporter n=1 Tax=Roseivivax isoporae LMG 25204 TaxID=1449351 RepID=X7FC01_9RHOB|nr:tripartite tricarboxylate transporter permease [Roseivivax isoporae]ETX30350.1 tricarboxylate transporter [Roseivivax isoporae LMG 25204]